MIDSDNAQRHSPVAVGVSVVALVAAMFVMATRQSDALSHQQQRTDIIARQTIFDEDLPRAARIRRMVPMINDRRLPNETRRMAAIALARMGDDAVFAVPVLIQLLQSEPDSVSWSAKALGIFGHRASVAAPELIRLLDHSESAPRNAAIEALAHIGASHSQVIPAMCQRLTIWSADRSPEYQLSLEYVLDGIGMIGPVASSCVPFILRTIESPNSRIRLAAVTALGHMGPRADNSIPALSERLAWDESPEVRDQAAIALSQVGEASIPHLMKLVHSDDAGLRIAALRAVGSIGITARDQLPTLIAQMEDVNAAVSLAAARAVHRVSAGGIDVSPILLQALSDADRQARMTAVKLFSEIGSHGRTPAVRKALGRLAASLNPKARQAAAQVLRGLPEP